MNTDTENRTESVKEMAMHVLARTLGKKFSPKKNIWETLKSVPWAEMCTGNFTQAELVLMNMVLDPKSCLGRVALMIALVEKYFPEIMPEVRCAEVKSDLFRKIMLEQWGTIYSERKLPPKSWFSELLMYEEPHSVLSVGGRQFDPLFCIYSESTDYPLDDLAHPAVIEFSPWEAIASFRMVSESFIFMDDQIQSRIKMLEDAERVCSGTLLVKQNLFSSLLLQDEVEHNKVTGLLIELCKESPNARGFFVLEKFFGKSLPSREEIYNENLWNLLTSCILCQ